MRITRLQSISDEEQKPTSPSLSVSLRRDLHSKCLFLTLLISASLSAVVWCKLSTRRPDRSPSSSSTSSSFVPTEYTVTTTRVPTTTTTTTGTPQQPAWPCDGSYIYIPASLLVMLYLVYLVECWHCHTRLDLRCRADVNTVYQRIAAFRQAPPVVWWKIVCYHYVRRARHMTRYRNGEAYTAAHAYYERVNSRCVTSAFNYLAVGVVDRSKKLVDLERYPATRVYVTKGFSFASIEAEREFVQQRSSFFQDYHHRDDYIEFREGIDLVNVNYRSQMTAFSSTDRFPWYVSKVSFWLASFLLLSWPLRVLIQYKTAIVHYHIHKVFGFGCGPHAEAPANPESLAALSRASTLDNYDLEKTILRNNSIVPSYSEALLMESEMRCQQQPRHQQPSCRNISSLYGTALRISASSTLLASGWRTQQQHPVNPYGSLNGDHVISAAWTTASLHRSRTGSASAAIAPAHARSCSNAIAAVSGRRLSWFESGTRERTRPNRTKAPRPETPQRRPLAVDGEERGGLEMTLLPLEITSLPPTVAATDNFSSNDASSTMQDIQQPWGPESTPSSNPVFRGNSSSSSSSSPSLSTSSSSPSSSAESLPSYETALGMAVLSDRERLLPSSSTRRTCASVSLATAAAAATLSLSSSSSNKQMMLSSRDDSRDDTDSVETTSTYISDQMDTPRHHPTVTPGSIRVTSCTFPVSSSTLRLQSTLSPSQRTQHRCRVIEDRETSL